MDNNNELKKYFIKDAELTSIDQDRLDYKDVAKNIEMVIEGTETPFNIALTGKSGAGKSSIINFLTEKYSKDSEKYNIKNINVWKENVSLKEYLQESFGRTEFDVDESSENEELGSSAQNEEKEKSKSKTVSVIVGICNAILTFVACFFITSIIFVIMEYFQNRDIYRANDIFFVENTYLNYSENIGLIMLFSFLLAAIAIVVYNLFIKKDKNKKEYINKDNKGKRTNRKNTEIITEEAEQTADVAVSQSNVKNIIIIEDIDKLSVAKMLKALGEMKYFNEYHNCIFIVPISKSMLKKAIEVRNKAKRDGKYKPLKFEKVFDKIFQFKFHVPATSSNRFKEYAMNLAEESIPDFIDEYSDDETMENVIRKVLIYKNVTTPRHVKKLINSFVNNKILAYQKYEKGEIDADFINAENFDLELAKISVLQSDFEEFYDLLFKNFSYLDKLTQLYSLTPEELDAEYENINDDLKPFVNAKYKSLKEFLNQTKVYKIDELVTLMYLTKNTSEKIVMGRPISSYIAGYEDISEWSNTQVLELIKSIDNDDDLREFTANNFEKLVDNYKNNCQDVEYFRDFNDNVFEIEEYIGNDNYMKYLDAVADNYDSYPEEALQLFKASKAEITEEVMVKVLGKIKKHLTPENYQDSFDVISQNSDCFFEENGNISEYVEFLVDYIHMSPNPDEVITELDENFTRIGKVYELNSNIKGLENCNFDNAYAFMAKCLDNGDLERMKYVINNILSDEDSVKDCLNIEEKMSKYNLVDVIECDVDDMIDEEMASVEMVEKSDKNSITNNFTLLKNLVELCVIKQILLNVSDFMKVIEKALANVDDKEYILSIYALLTKVDRMYFYESRRDYNEIIYASFHAAKDDEVRKAALDCTRYFRNTRLFKTKLTKEEEKFYSEN